MSFFSARKHTGTGDNSLPEHVAEGVSKSQVCLAGVLIVLNFGDLRGRGSLVHAVGASEDALLARSDASKESLLLHACANRRSGHHNLLAVLASLLGSCVD